MPKPKPRPKNKAQQPQIPAPVAVAPPFVPPKLAKGEIDPASGRPVEYPEYETALCYGENAVTVEQMKQILGWEEIAEGAGRDAVALFKDFNGLPIRCNNIHNNRPFEIADALKYAQEHLNRRWRFNGENFIVGRTALVISGQHRGVGLVLAEQQRVHPEERYKWEDRWPGPVTMETSMIFGIDESAETTVTLDNTRTRTLADCEYADPEMFPTSGPADRRKLVKILDYAVRFLWERTGAVDDPHSPRRTISELRDWRSRHPRIQEAVLHVYEEDKKSGVISYFLSALGTAAGLLYLMGTSATPYDSYHDREGGYRESKVDFSNWDAALKFWAELGRAAKIKILDDGSKAAAPGAGPLVALFKTWRPRIGDSRPAAGESPNDTGLMFGKDGADRQSRIAALIHAWACYVTGTPIRPSDLELEFKREYGDDGLLTDWWLAESPVVDGIDVLSGKEEEEEPDSGEEGDNEQVDTPAGEPDPEVVEKRKAKAQERKAADNAKAAGVVIRKGGQSAIEEAPTDDTGHLSNGLAADLALLKGRHPGRLLLFRCNDGKEVQAWGSDADDLAKVMDFKKVRHPDGLSRIKFDAAHLDKVRDQLLAAGKKVALLDLDSEEKKVVAEWPAPALATGAPPADPVAPIADDPELPARSAPKPKARKSPTGSYLRLKVSNA
jgi:hypothetical protein